MTRDERWNKRFVEVKTFIENNKRNPSKYRIEEHDMLIWLKANRKRLNAGELKEERVELFEKLLALCEEYRRVNQYQSTMETFIEYEAKVRWGRFIDVAPEVWERFVNEINLFHPIAPIQTTNSEFFFSVKEENDSSYISVKTAVDRTNFGDEPIESYGNLLDETIVRRLKDFFFSINLAYPGHLHVFNSFLYRYGVPVCSFSYSTGTSGMAYKRFRWLPFEDLTIKQCWDWLTTKTSFLSYISRTPIDRALFALTYESVANDDLDIFYVLLGIEALYNDGSNREESISAQLKRKVQAVLGPLPQAALSEMNKMYGVRSALVHGAADIFKCWPSEEYSMTECEKIGKDRDHILIATGILLASIQKFIKANANELIETTTVELK